MTQVVKVTRHPGQREGGNKVKRGEGILSEVGVALIPSSPVQ